MGRGAEGLAGSRFGVKRVYAEKPRERVLTEEEIRSLWPLFERLQPTEYDPDARSELWERV